jgi:hypothetical protein
MKTTALTIVVVMFIVTALFINYNKPTAAMPLTSATPQLTDEAARRDAFKKWIRSTEELVGATQDKDARSVLEFVKSSALLAKPTRICAEFLEGGREGMTTHFAVIMLRQGDETVSPQWAEYASDHATAGAHYMPDEGLMIIKSNFEFSRFCQGLIMLHEGRHAQQFLTRHYDWKSPRTFCEEERDTHEFQNRITSMKLGEAYSEYVIALTEEMTAELAKQGFKPGEAHADRRRDFTEFDALWPTKSRLERDFRDTSIWIHANFVMLDQTFGKDAADQKALFLFSRYKEKGMFPDVE